MESRKKMDIFLDGLLRKNPLLVLLLGVGPSLSVSTHASKALSMGLCVSLILIISNIMLSALKRIIPEEVRIPCSVAIISGFVLLLQMLLKAYLPGLYASTGSYLGLAIINCIILGRAEAFARKNSIARSAMDGFAMGLGYTLILTLLAVIRELFGCGTIFGMDVTFGRITPMSIFMMAPGGLFVLGCIAALINKIRASAEINEGGAEQ